MARVDSHTHFDEIHDTGMIEVFLKHQINIISWAFIKKQPDTLREFETYFREQEKRCEQGRKQGLSIYQLIGIHPRSIPVECYKQINESEILKLLNTHLSKSYIKGIGEIGLETADETERKIFALQVKCAIEKNYPICIHTPRKEKEEVLIKIIEILKEMRPNPEKVLIDHMTTSEMLKKYLIWGTMQELLSAKAKLHSKMPLQ